MERQDADLEGMGLDDPLLEKWPQPWRKIAHLIRLYRGRGMGWTTFQVAAANKEFKTYEDKTRKSRKTGEFVSVWMWPQVRSYLDRSINEVPR